MHDPVRAFVAYDQGESQAQPWRSAMFPRQCRDWFLSRTFRGQAIGETGSPMMERR
jgi:hypothetical protein